MAGTDDLYYNDNTGDYNGAPDQVPDWQASSDPYATYSTGQNADTVYFDPYSGYTTGQAYDPNSTAYDPSLSGNWWDRLTSGNGIAGAWDGIKKAWDGLDDKTKSRLLGAAGGAGLAALTAPAGSKWLEPTTTTYNAGAAPGFVNMNRKLVRTPTGNATGNKFTTTYAAKGGVMPGGPGQSGGLGRYLGGPTDGMADKIPATIDGKQPAKLAHGEFVIPADVVSHLGNGNSDAGAQKLYKMMERIRMARTGNPEQGKQINPDKFLPMMGKAPKGMAAGGIVSFADGGAAPFANQNVVSTEQGVSNWAAPYVGDMLSNANAAANAPYQAYQGPLTAGPSALQTQTSQGLQGIATPANYGKSFTDQGVAQQYMNPYLQLSLNPQLDELRRQSGITQVGNDAKMTQAGAFGGDRQALLTAETQRNLQQQQEQTTGNAYNNAFNAAMGQFNAEQGQGQNLMAQKAAVGATDQTTAQNDINAQKTAFEQERDNPFQMLKFQQSMLQGLPLTAQGTTTSTPSIVQQMAGGAAGGISLADILAGRTGGTTTPAPKVQAGSAN
jgi:hypothetical protein